MVYVMAFLYLTYTCYNPFFNKCKFSYYYCGNNRRHILGRDVAYPCELIISNHMADWRNRLEQIQNKFKF